MNGWLSLDWLGSLALRGAVLLGLALVLGLLLRRVSAGQRYGLWLAVMTGLLLLPPLLGWGPAWRVLPKLATEMALPPVESFAELEAEPGEAALPAPAQAERPPITFAVPEVPPPLSAPISPPASAQETPRVNWGALAAWLPALWLLGVTTGLGRLGFTHWRLRRLRLGKASARVPQTPRHAEPEPSLLREVTRELGLRQPPQLILGAADAMPMVWGVRRPCLLLPAGFENWPPAKRRAVLLHELAHLARRDPLALWLGQLARALHWFNPLAWLALRRLRADQERACDDTVLRYGVRASDYAQVLLDLSRQRRPGSGLALGALAMARPGPVEQRLEAILDSKCSRAGASRGWRLLWVTLGLTVALPLAVLHAVEDAKARGKIVDRHGVVLAETGADGLRVYPQRELAAHVVGYVITNQAKAGVIEGGDGIEKSSDDELSKGTEVRLTLDTRLQQQAQEELQASKQNGALVLMEVATGELLALVSWPGYDLNDWIPRLEPEVYEKWRDDPGKPILPRATFAQYPPGLSFSLVTALAAMAAGQGDAVFHCEPSLKIGDRTFHNWSKTDMGEFDLERAIVRRHNVYFYQLALKLGHEPLAAMAAKLGFAEKTGLPLQAEAPGNIYTFPLSEKRQGRTLSGGEIANSSIGQGETLATPVQLARLAALIASRGKAPGPVLVKGDTGKPAVDLGVSKEDWDRLHRALRCDVPGTASARGASEQVSIAMMTGTAQWKFNQQQNLANVIGFAPVENPRVAFAVVLEGRPEQRVSGGGMAAPVAKKIVEAWLQTGAPVEETSETGKDKTTSQTGSANEDLNQTWQLQGISKSGSSPYQISLRHKQTLELVNIKEGETHDDFHVVEVHPSRNRAETRVILERDGVRSVIHFDLKAAVAALTTKASHLQARQQQPTPADEQGPGTVTERRWRLVQDEGGLGELPAGAREMKSYLMGIVWPRQVRVSFVAPQQEVMDWLEFSPGRVRDSRILLLNLPNQIRLSEALRQKRQSIVTLNGEPIDFGQQDHWHEKWKRICEDANAGKTGNLGIVPCEKGVHVQLFKRQEAEIEVTVTRAPSESPNLAE